MSWTFPKTWAPGEMVDNTMLNTHLKADLDFLKLRHDSDGSLRWGFYEFGDSAGQGNAASIGWTGLTSFDLYIPANLIKRPGEGLHIAGNWETNATAATREGGFRLNDSSGTLVKTYSGTDTSKNCQFWVNVTYRTSVTGIAYGLYMTGSNPRTPEGIYYALSSIDWTASQLLRFAAYSSVATADVIKLRCLTVLTYTSVEGELL